LERNEKEGGCRDKGLDFSDIPFLPMIIIGAADIFTKNPSAEKISTDGTFH
jgi:hypothetical protein